MNEAAFRPGGLNSFLKLSGLVTFTAAVFGMLGSSSFGQELTWRERAPLSLARAGYMAGVVHGKYVIAGGSYWADKQKRWTDEVDVYDPVDDVWSRAPNLPVPMSDAASVALDNELYLFGGGANGSIRRDALVLRKGKWQTLPGAELPEPRLYAVAVADRGLIYVLGGLSNHDDYTSLSNKVWVWNPDTPDNGWKNVQPLPGPGLMTTAVAAVNGKIYVLGGAKAGGADVVNVETAYEYDPQTDKWVILPPLPLSRRCWWGLAAPPDIYLFGGYTSTNESDVFSYNFATKTLTKIGQMPHGLCDAKFFRIGGSIYGVGGESAPGIRGKWTLEAMLPGKRKTAGK
jgi:N-acetylneuraminic acid mutarotase